MRTWDLIALLFCSTNRLSLAVVCLSLPFWHFFFYIFFFILQINSPSPPPEKFFFATCTQKHTKHSTANHISWKPQRYVRLACSSQVINKGNTSFICSGEWVTLDEVIALYTCLLYLSSLFLSLLYIPTLFFSLFTSHLTLFALSTDCPETDNSVFEHLLNFCVYGSWLCVLPIPCDRSQWA